MSVTSPNELVEIDVHRGRRWRPVQKTDISAGVAVAVTASRLVLAGDCDGLVGWNLTETTGAAVATVRFHDGNSAQAESFGRITLTANGSTTIIHAEDGLICNTGRIFLEVVAGSVEGVIYWLAKP